MCTSLILISYLCFFLFTLFFQVSNRPPSTPAIARSRTSRYAIFKGPVVDSLCWNHDSLLLTTLLQLKPDQVDSYMRAQRIHQVRAGRNSSRRIEIPFYCNILHLVFLVQNNVEFYASFFPIFLITGLYAPLATAIAGLVVLLGRVAYFFGYSVRYIPCTTRNIFKSSVSHLLAH